MFKHHLRRVREEDRPVRQCVHLRRAIREIEYERTDNKLLQTLLVLDAWLRIEYFLPESINTYMGEEIGILLDGGYGEGSQIDDYLDR